MNLGQIEPVGSGSCVSWPVRSSSSAITRVASAIPKPATDAARLVDEPVNDVKRCRYIVDHVAGMKTAIANGTGVRGYYVWSSHDNLEWLSGYGSQATLRTDHTVRSAALRAADRRVDAPSKPARFEMDPQPPQERPLFPSCFLEAAGCLTTGSVGL